MIIESIKQGFDLTHKNWQVILLKVAVGIINLVGFFIIVGIPFIIGILTLGVDIAQARDILPEIVNDPFEFFSKYLGLTILIFIAIVIYFFIVSIVLLYIFSGTLGVLRNAALDRDYKFSFSSFFREARNAFFPLLWLFSVSFLIITALIVFFGILASVLISLTGISGDAKTPFSVFITYFFSLLGIAILIAFIIYTAFAAIVLVIERSRVLNSFKLTWNFVKNTPMSFGFYILLIIGAIAVNFILIALGASLGSAPMVGFLFIIPHRLISSIIQSYLGMVMWGSLIAYYLKAVHYRNQTDSVHTYDI
jgi:hypothetical protein